MDPNNQPPQPPSQYDFIMQSEHAKTSRLSVNNGSTKQRALTFFGGVVVLIIIAILFSSLVLGSREGSAKLLIDLAARQQEIIRISEFGVTENASPDVRALAQTVKLSVSSQQTELITYLGTKKQKVSTAQLTALESPEVDAALTSASKNNRFDKEFRQTLEEYLAVYNQEIEKAYDAAGNSESKAILKRSFDSNELVLST